MIFEGMTIKANEDGTIDLAFKAEIAIAFLKALSNKKGFVDVKCHKRKEISEKGFTHFPTVATQAKEITVE